MIRIMFDSDVIADLPRNAMAATYADLITTKAQLDSLRAEFPFGLLLIDRGHGDPLDEAVIIDVETGAHKPADAPGWYDAKAKAGKTGLTVYVNRSNLDAVNAAMGTRKFFRWVATLNGTMSIPGFAPGKAPAAVQGLNATMLGFHADGSIVWEPQWHPSKDTQVWDGIDVQIQVLNTAAADIASVTKVMMGHR